MTTLIKLTQVLSMTMSQPIYINPEFILQVEWANTHSLVSLLLSDPIEVLESPPTIADLVSRKDL